MEDIKFRFSTDIQKAMKENSEESEYQKMQAYLHLTAMTGYEKYQDKLSLIPTGAYEYVNNEMRVVVCLLNLTEEIVYDLRIVSNLYGTKDKVASKPFVFKIEEAEHGKIAVNEGYILTLVYPDAFETEVADQHMHLIARTHYREDFTDTEPYYYQG